MQSVFFNAHVCHAKLCRTLCRKLRRNLRQILIHPIRFKSAFGCCEERTPQNRSEFDRMEAWKIEARTRPRVLSLRSLRLKISVLTAHQKSSIDFQPLTTITSRDVNLNTSSFALQISQFQS